MATDATGTPTPLGIPKYNVDADAPSGLGFNAAMDSIDALIAARVAKPLGIVSGEVSVWNGSGWDRSSVTRVGASSLGSGTADATKELRGDGAWVPSFGVLIQTVQLGANGDITFSAIPQTFTHLLVKVKMARSIVASNNEAMVMQFNGDTTASYDRYDIHNTNGVLGQSGLQAGTYLFTFSVTGASDGTGKFHGVGDINIYNYTANNVRRSVTASGHEPFAGVQVFSSGSWNNVTDPITSIRLTGVTSSLAAGSTATLYGIPS